ncbi:hypothetical protein Pfo_029166 [Paulownia fortunei]|nr:hypothetical protein Pfo_029166 [Paulownia fortunei]
MGYIISFIPKLALDGDLGCFPPHELTDHKESTFSVNNDIENDKVTPVIYEDEDESTDDEGSEDSMEVENVQDGEENGEISD